MFILSEQNTIANHFIAEIRDKNIQQDRVRFRKNITRLGSMLAYEISKKLEYQKKTISTPLGESVISLPTQVPVVATILRAGLPFFQGFLEIFEQADTAFIGAKRNHPIDGSENDISISVDYLSAPSLDKKVLIITDPMLATGQSIVRVLEILHQIGTPSDIYIFHLRPHRLLLVLYHP